MSFLCYVLYTGNFDSVLELLAKASPRVLPECMMMMIPEAWQDNQHLSDSKRGMITSSLLGNFSIQFSHLFAISWVPSSLLRIQLLHHGALGWTRHDRFH